jgi:cobalt-zinc-cadmium efflux system membrane fusion protein
MAVRSTSFTVAVICLVIGGVVGAAVTKYRAGTAAPAKPAPLRQIDTAEAGRSVHLHPDDRDTVVVPDEVIQSLGIRTARVESAIRSRPIRMPGSLMLDSNRLARIHSRFEGHVVSLGSSRDEAGQMRPLQFGDPVKKDQVLAVIWSKEIGQKKSELLDAYSQYRLSRATYDRLKGLKPGEVSEHVLRDAQRNYEAALIAVQNGERTLRSWQLSENDIQAIQHEADRIGSQGAEQPAVAALREGWAELAVRAPFDGVILEKNITIGEIIDAGLDLFKLADVNRLMVVANIYEEDLSEIDALPRNKRFWKISLTAEPDEPPLSGSFEIVGKIIDPVQHTAQLVGWVENKDQHLMAGQFITALVELPPRQHEVVVPAAAVVENGEEGIIYVVAEHGEQEFVRRKVVVSHRGRSFVHLRTLLTDDEKSRGLTALTADMRVVISGVVLLENTWKELGLTQPRDQPQLARTGATDH